MRRISGILIAILIIVSCKNQVANSDWYEIRNSNSIEKYQDFLIQNPETKYLKEIADSLRLFWHRESLKDFEHYKHRNNLIIEIKNDQLRFDDSIIEKEKLADTLKYSIKNPHDWTDFAEKVIVEIEIS